MLCAASVSVSVLGALAFFPNATQSWRSLADPWNLLIGSVLGITLVAFHFSMLVECIRARPWTLTHAAWTALMLLVPIVPAVIYFMISRSTRLETCAGARHGLNDHRTGIGRGRE